MAANSAAIVSAQRRRASAANASSCAGAQSGGDSKGAGFHGRYSGVTARRALFDKPPNRGHDVVADRVARDGAMRNTRIAVFGHDASPLLHPRNKLLLRGLPLRESAVTDVWAADQNDSGPGLPNRFIASEPPTSRSRRHFGGAPRKGGELSPMNCHFRQSTLPVKRIASSTMSGVSSFSAPPAPACGSTPFSRRKDLIISPRAP